MKKIFAWTLVLMGAGFLSWYFFVRESDIEVHFKARTVAGDIVETLRIWDRSADSTQIASVDSVFEVVQQVRSLGHDYIFKWELQAIDDSTTAVNVKITEPGHEWKNKLLVPFSTPPVEQAAAQLGRQFYDILQKHLDITSVTLEGLQSLEPRYCVCTTISAPQVEKASGMMKTYSFMLDFIEKNQLTVTGKPIVSITGWSHNQGKIRYDFCFPVAERPEMPVSDFFSYQTIGAEKALKASYHGNYITSDRAWYYLKEQAAREGLVPSAMPIEIFYNNPNTGIDEASWLAEIFLPVQ